MKSRFSRIFWPVFIGLAVYTLDTKQAYPEFMSTLLHGCRAAYVVFAVMYFATHRTTVSAFVMAVATTLVFYAIAVNLTGEPYMMSVYAFVVFVVAETAFVVLNRHRSRLTVDRA